MRPKYVSRKILILTAIPITLAFLFCFCARIVRASSIPNFRINISPREVSPTPTLTPTPTPTPTSSQAAINFSGKAYPQSSVTLLKDAQIAATTIAGSDANFQMSLTGLTPGNYIFSLYSEDYKDRRSSLYNFSSSVSAGTTTTMSGIFIAPTTDTNKSQVKQGENLSILGQSVPKGELTIEVHSDQSVFFKTQADQDGLWSYNLDTALFDLGEHFTKSKASLDDEISNLSRAISFNIGAQTVYRKTAEIPGELNDDGRINLVDFSVVAYWYKRPSPPAKVDLNNDNKVDLVDFSIMAYYWTG